MNHSRISFYSRKETENFLKIDMEKDTIFHELPFNIKFIMITTENDIFSNPVLPEHQSRALSPLDKAR